MPQYIDKYALIEIIDNLKHKIDDRYSYSSGWKDALSMVEAELDTLEVKEVDLEEEVEDYIDKYNGVWVDSDYIKFARHFFELGIKAQKGE